MVASLAISNATRVVLAQKKKLPLLFFLVVSLPCVVANRLTTRISFPVPCENRASLPDVHSLIPKPQECARASFSGTVACPSKEGWCRAWCIDRLLQALEMFWCPALSFWFPGNNGRNLLKHLSDFVETTFARKFRPAWMLVACWFLPEVQCGVDLFSPPPPPPIVVLRVSTRECSASFHLPVSHSRLSLGFTHVTRARHVSTGSPRDLTRLFQIMTALYDYNPEEQSPQDNPDSELAFKKGQIIRILGDMVTDCWTSFAWVYTCVLCSPLPPRENDPPVPN